MIEKFLTATNRYFLHNITTTLQSFTDSFQYTF